jgi:predicted  nucleic acid-binding Zn-ribbon protein
LKEQLLALRSLQSIDQRMADHRRSQNQLDAQLKDLRAGVQLLSVDLLRREEELDETRQLKEEHEAALKAQQESIGRSKNKMSGARKNQEWMAIQKEIEQGNKAASVKEDELLKIIEVEEATRAALQERRRRLTELRAQVVAFEANHQERTAELKGRLDEMEEQRKELLAGLPQKLVRQYERIREARDGTALAEVKDELCLACHMAIQPQLYNQLQRGDQLVSCPSCNRILYFVGHDAAANPAA